MSKTSKKETTKKVQEIVEESETTENEFSEAEEVKFRV